MPWLSVVVPTFNRASYLKVCLDSLRAQSCPDWECLIIDDGSTDDSAVVADRFVSSDGRFVYHQQANAGVSAARNTGLERARGEWIAFLDSDDFYFRGTVERFRLANTSCMHRGVPPPIISGQLIASGQEPPPPGSSAALSVRDLFFRVMNFSKKGRSPLLQNTIFHRSTLQAMEGGFSTSLPTCEDREFLIRAAAAADVLLLEAPVSHYRTDHGLGKSDHFMATGGKLKAHRHIYTTLDQAGVIRRRLSTRGELADFTRLRAAYLAVLDAVDLVAGGYAEAAADQMMTAEGQCHNDEEREALAKTFSFFFLFPTSRPRTAIRRSLRALAQLCGHLKSDSPAGTAIQERIRALSERLFDGGSRHILVPARPESEDAAAALCPTLEAEGAATRFVARPMNVAPLPAGRALLSNPLVGAFSVDRDVAATILGCSVFRTIEQHVQMATLKGLCGLDRQQAVQQAMEQLRTRGGLVALEEVLGVASEAKVDRQEISYLAIEADDDFTRAARTLESYAENAAAHGRHPAILVFDRVVERNGCPKRAHQLRALAGRFGLSLRHAGPQQRHGYARLLAREAGLAEELVGLALVDDEERGLGAALNGVLLETAGSSVMVVRGGSRCQPARLLNERPGMFVGAGARSRTLAFDSRSALANALCWPELDLLAVHEQYLGASAEDLMRGRAGANMDSAWAQLLARGRPIRPQVTATMSSAYGCLGDEDPKAVLLSRDSFDPRLLATPELYRSTARHEHVWKGVSELTVGKLGTFDLRATALLNQPCSWPPFLPFLSYPETVFGWAAIAIQENACFAHLPAAVNVEIDPGAEGPLAERGTEIRYRNFSNLVEACLLLYRCAPGGGGPGESMAALGEHLCALSRLPLEDLLVLLRPIFCGWVSQQLRSLDYLLKDHQDDRPHWSNDARRYRQQLLDGVVADRPAMATDDDLALKPIFAARWMRWKRDFCRANR
jgi:hypothetical protein